MMKDVPMVGWDVAFTTKGICLLEVNLSCNFFRGSFDVPKYLNFVESYWKDLDDAVPKSAR
jgi:glutathione synthase/RimK-type ligase-like ATP-grasp enzyme